MNTGQIAQWNSNSEKMYRPTIFLQFLHQLYKPTHIIITAIRIPRISILIDNFIIKFIDFDDYHALVTYYQN